MRGQSKFQFVRSHALFSSYRSLIARIVLIGMVVLVGGLALAAKAVTANGTALIPEDAIRIRIIANSDSEFDQRVKEDVRRRVAMLIGSWGVMPKTHDEARALIEAHLSEVNETVSETLSEYKVEYDSEAVLAKVPFPAKVFEGQSYAAGDYEALRITLGQAQGSNWWCVLFPPLCLTAAAAPDEDAQTDNGSPLQTSNTDSKPEPKFFLVEIFEMLFGFIKSLFS